MSLKDDGSGQVAIDGLTEVNIQSSDQVFTKIKEGNEVRKVGQTNMNDRSSRSHTIFRIIIESSDSQVDEIGNEAGRAIMVSHLNLVDLAGSERAAQTGATGERLREGDYL